MDYDSGIGLGAVEGVLVTAGGGGGRKEELHWSKKPRRRLSDSARRQFVIDYDQMLKNHPNDHAAQSEAYMLLIKQYDIAETSATRLMRKVGCQEGPAAAKKITRGDRVRDGGVVDPISFPWPFGENEEGASCLAGEKSGSSCGGERNGEVESVNGVYDWDALVKKRQKKLSEEEKNSFIQAHTALQGLPKSKDREAQMDHLRESFGISKDTSRALLRNAGLSARSGHKGAEQGARPHAWTDPESLANPFDVLRHPSTGKTIPRTTSQLNLLPSVEALYSGALKFDHASAWQHSSGSGAGGLKRSASEMMSSAPCHGTIKTEYEEPSPAALCFMSTAAFCDTPRGEYTHDGVQEIQETEKREPQWRTEVIPCFSNVEADLHICKVRRVRVTGT